MVTNTFQSDIAIHPGVSLEEMIDAVGMSQAELAVRTGLTPKTINEIIQGKNPVTPDTAIKLAAVFGMSAEYWNNKERRYQETLAYLRQKSEFEKEKGFLKKFSTYKPLQELGFLPDTKDPNEKIRALLSFFGVSSLEYIPQTQAVAFRKMTTLKVDNYAVAAWLRAGEKKAQEIQTAPFNKEKLVNSIPQLRKLSTKKPEEYGREIRDLLASCGVAVVYMPYFEKTYVHGATRWLSSDKALIQLSLLYKWEDIFWFSLFHELGHIIKHGKREEFIEFKNDSHQLDERKEKEADDFAQKELIPEGALSQMSDRSPASIRTLAKKIGIAPSIVAGRVAYELSRRGNHEVWKQYSSLRPRLQLSGNGD
jgi:HTH-type transcriptional regulator/antitoxin HigA